jgi:hypothetical protein
MTTKPEHSSFFDQVTGFLLGNNFFSEILKVSGILYFFGFIITRSHLLNYGITEINLLETKYISVGLFFIINVAIVWLPFIVQEINEIEEEKQKQKQKQNKKITQSPYVLISFLISISFLILLVFIIVNLPDTITVFEHIFIISILFVFLLLSVEIVFNDLNILLPKKVLTIIQIIVAILVAHLFLYSSCIWIKTIDINIFNLRDLFWSAEIKDTLISHRDDYYLSLGDLILTWYLSLLIIGGSLYLLISKKVNIDSKSVLFVQARYWLIAIITILSLFSIQKYSYHIYPVIPANLGGGSPTTVELILSKSDIQETDKKYPIKFFSNGENENISNLVCLIAETNDYYYISPCRDIIKKYEDLYKKPKNLLYKKLKRLKQDKNVEKTIQIKKTDILTIIYNKV